MSDTIERFTLLDRDGLADPNVVREADPDGEWVRYADVARLTAERGEILAATGYAELPTMAWKTLPELVAWLLKNGETYENFADARDADAYRYYKHVGYQWPPGTNWGEAAASLADDAIAKVDALTADRDRLAAEVGRLREAIRRWVDACPVFTVPASGVDGKRMMDELDAAAKALAALAPPKEADRD